MSISRLHAIAFGGAAAASGLVGIRVADAAAINVYRSAPTSVTTSIQPLHTGNYANALDFTLDRATQPITVDVDFVVQASTYGTTVYSQVCRQAWNGAAVSCSAVTSAVYAASGSNASHELTVSTTAVQSTTNSPWDYYYAVTNAVNSSSGSAVSFVPVGVGVSGW